MNRPTTARRGRGAVIHSDRWSRSSSHRLFTLPHHLRVTYLQRRTLPLKHLTLSTVYHAHSRFPERRVVLLWECSVAFVVFDLGAPSFTPQQLKMLKMNAKSSARGTVGSARHSPTSHQQTSRLYPPETTLRPLVLRAPRPGFNILRGGRLHDCHDADLPVRVQIEFPIGKPCRVRSLSIAVAHQEKEFHYDNLHRYAPRVRVAKRFDTHDGLQRLLVRPSSHLLVAPCSNNGPLRFKHSSNLEPMKNTLDAPP